MTADTLLGQGLWERERVFICMSGGYRAQYNTLLPVLRRHLTEIKFSVKTLKTQ